MEGNPKLRFKDRYFSVKLQPLKEGKWWPAIAIGANDPYGTDSKEGTGKEGESPQNGDGKSQYFSNYYIAATKHIGLKGHSIGIHVASAIGSATITASGTARWAALLISLLSKRICA